MSDYRTIQLAEKVVRYSLDIQPGEKVMINCSMESLPLAKEIISETYRAGGRPFVNLVSEELRGRLYAGATREHVEAMVEYDAWKTKDMDAVVNMVVPRNDFEDAGEYRYQADQWIYQKKLALGIARMRKGLKNTVLSYPTHVTARAAQMSLDDYEAFYFGACLMDYDKFGKAMQLLADEMQRTDKVRILGTGTDLSFSIKDCPAEISAGTWNMPDGEALCAPCLHSANGRITYNIPSRQKGLTFEGVSFELREGKIIKATANYTDQLNRILDTDPGARYIGEFAFGLNPRITKPTNSILFDEKMAGTIHFTPGNSLERMSNGNCSQIHWDLIHSHRPEHGGGEIWFDDRLIRKDGVFLLPQLSCLNEFMEG